MAQFVFALLLELCHRVQHHSNEVKSGWWSSHQDFCFWDYPLVELHGKTIGIIGFGRIGRQVARIADAMGMRVIAHDSYQNNTPDYEGFQWMEIDGLLRDSDVVSLHCPLFPETQGMINKNTLCNMKKSAFLINTSRGGLIVDKDLAEALENKNIAGAALDVLSVEPPVKDNPLYKQNNCIITPHIAWATLEARSRLMDIAVNNLKEFLNGKIINKVN